jgi:predicted  nucleic acid-binding Zn-ribbon protein
MPRKFTRHDTAAALEDEFVELWRRLDALYQQVERHEGRLDKAEESIEELGEQTEQT